jgi:hypothetical protein
MFAAAVPALAACCLHNTGRNETLRCAAAAEHLATKTCVLQALLQTTAQQTSSLTSLHLQNDNSAPVGLNCAAAIPATIV